MAWLLALGLALGLAADRSAAQLSCNPQKLNRDAADTIEKARRAPCDADAVEDSLRESAEEFVDWAEQAGNQLAGTAKTETDRLVRETRTSVTALSGPVEQRLLNRYAARGQPLIRKIYGNDAEELDDLGRAAACRAKRAWERSLIWSRKWTHCDFDAADGDDEEPAGSPEDDETEDTDEEEDVDDGR